MDRAKIGAKATVELSQATLDAIGTAIEVGKTADLGDAIKGFKGYVDAIQNKSGVGIWVEVSYQKCVECGFLWWSKCWELKDKCVRCSAFGTGRQFEDGFDPNDVAGITASTKRCLEEATREVRGEKEPWKKGINF